LNTLLIILASASLILAGVLALLLWRSSRVRERITGLLKADRGESLEGAAGRLLLSARQAEGDSAEFRSSFDHLMANCPLPVLLLDDNLLITNLSHKAETELDQPRRQRSLMEGLESNELELAARAAIQSLKPAEITVRLYAAGRRTYHARLLPFQAGQLRRCLIFLQSAATTVEFGELRSQFAATVSHELRTPLAGIRAMVETLKDPEIPSEDRERFLEKIDRETNRLGQLVDDILFLSSLESGASNLEGATELRPLVESLLEKLEPLSANFEVKIRASVPEGLNVPLPERMASTVLSNLLENAVKYSGRGSQVEVIAGREGSYIKFQVKDDGIGIDAEHLPHIFERFYRVDKSRSRRLGGTGLGLSIVKHVVESAGGEVGVNSREGFGTEITVLLPKGG
jgi:two-component system phosphate regulon sensor histidine kinase PhoR